MATETVSGAPDKVIWDENNHLVEPELKAHFEEASAAVMRTDEEAGALLDFDLEAPAKAQAQDGATKDPMTSPQPSADPNSAPTPITIAADVPSSESTTPVSPPKPPPPVEKPSEPVTTTDSDSDGK